MAPLPRPTDLGRHTTRRRLAAVAIGIVLALITIPIALAQGDLGGKLRTGTDVRVGADETVRTDLYLAGSTVTVDGTIDGDLVATGGQVTLNGSVSGDVLVAGGTVRIGGEVAGDVRVAGGQVTIAGSVGEDALMAGGQLLIDSPATIGEDAIVSGGQVTMAGTITGSIIGSAGTYSRTGTVGGTDEVMVTQVQPPAPAEPPNVVADAIRHFLAVLLLGLLALWLAPRVMAVAERTIRRRPATAVGWGLLALIGFIGLVILIPILAVLLAILFGVLGFGDLAALAVLIGFTVVFALILAFVVVAGYIVDALVGLALARLVIRDREPAEIDELATDRSWLTGRVLLQLVVGAAVVVLVTWLPVIGGVARLVVVILGLGALLFAIVRGPRGRAARPVPPEPVV